MMFLVRSRAWWFNKVPLSILLLALLVDGRPLSLASLMALLGLVGSVCGVGNYGYALNELFDRDEDRRVGRSNAAQSVSNLRMWSIIGASAAFALAFSFSSGGLPAAALTAGALLLPLAYSVPPLRIKERGWFGVVSDALAAHVYPAGLALLVVSNQSLRAPTTVLVASVMIWSLATGLRGILSHQLQSAESDRRAGLTTVVHRLGHARLVALVKHGVLPIEVLGFTAAFLACDTGAFAKGVCVVYLLYECLKCRFDVFPVIVFDRQNEHYIPFVDEGFYKVIGPLAFMLDAAYADIRYLLLLPLYCWSFKPRVMAEWHQCRSACGSLLRELQAARLARSRGRP